MIKKTTFFLDLDQIIIKIFVNMMARRCGHLRRDQHHRGPEEDGAGVHPRAHGRDAGGVRGEHLQRPAGAAAIITLITLIVV